MNLWRTLSTTKQMAKPIVAVIGTTGVGKSQLAVSLAQSLHPQNYGYRKGTILSADSMQLYRGLDVITNKVTADEKGGVDHWGLDMVSPGQGGSWEVGRWCSEATKQVGRIVGVAHDRSSNCRQTLCPSSAVGPITLSSTTCFRQRKCHSSDLRHPYKKPPLIR